MQRSWGRHDYIRSLSKQEGGPCAWSRGVNGAERKKSPARLAHWVKALTTEPVDLSLILGTCMMEGEN